MSDMCRLLDVIDYLCSDQTLKHIAMYKDFFDMLCRSMSDIQVSFLKVFAVSFPVLYVLMDSSFPSFGRIELFTRVMYAAATSVFVGIEGYVVATAISFKIDGIEKSIYMVVSLIVLMFGCLLFVTVNYFVHELAGNILIAAIVFGCGGLILWLFIYFAILKPFCSGKNPTKVLQHNDREDGNETH